MDEIHENNTKVDKYFPFFLLIRSVSSPLPSVCLDILVRHLVHVNLLLPLKAPVSSCFPALFVYSVNLFQASKHFGHSFLKGDYSFTVSRLCAFYLILASILIRCFPAVYCLFSLQQQHTETAVGIKMHDK